MSIQYSFLLSGRLFKNALVARFKFVLSQNKNLERRQKAEENSHASSTTDKKTEKEK